MTGAARTRARRRRSAARLACVQALYEIDVTGSPSDPVVREFIAERWKSAGQGQGDDVAPDAGFLSDLVHGVCTDLPKLDQAIARALSDRDLSRLEVLLRAVLRAGAYELADRLDIPAKVVINEYVDVAHAFFAGRETALVNAVLDRLATILRGDTAVAVRHDDESPAG